MKPRKAVVAGLFSLLVPGLGQLYAGKPVRASAVWIACALAPALAIASISFLSLRPFNLLAAAVILLGPFVFAVVDAALQARSARLQRRPHYDRWYVYAAIILVALWVVQPRIVTGLRARFAEAFRLQADSMAPTFLAGDYLLVGKLGTDRAHRAAFFRRELVVFRSPNPANGIMLKRIVGLPGDTLAMRRKVLFINHYPVYERYIKHVDQRNDLFVPGMLWQRRYFRGDTAAYRPTRDSWGPLVVPPASVFVLGDNRDDSEDSRYYGFVPMANIIARPRMVYFSWDRSTRSVRWQRIGLAVHG